MSVRQAPVQVSTWKQQIMPGRFAIVTVNPVCELRNEILVEVSNCNIAHLGNLLRFMHATIEYVSASLCLFKHVQ